jgi:hypothetical protein
MAEIARDDERSVGFQTLVYNDGVGFVTHVNFLLAEFYSGLQGFLVRLEAFPGLEVRHENIVPVAFEKGRGASFSAIRPRASPCFPLRYIPPFPCCL